MAVGVTGADGFIGRDLCRTLEDHGRKVIRIVRRKQGAGEERRVVGDLAEATNLNALLDGVDVIFHLAGRAHVLNETAADPCAAFQRANVDATMRLAEAAVRVKARRFVFISSIGVNGSETHGRPFTELNKPAPTEEYARSKLKAEQSLGAFCKQNGLEFVVVRPPLVYGPGASGNFARLVKLAASGWPLPIGAVHNRRNIVGVRNLCDFLLLCSKSPAARDETFVIAEPEAYSTADLIVTLRKALGQSSRVFSVPAKLLHSCAKVMGMDREFKKFCGSLEISSSKAEVLLGWKPTLSLAQEFDRAIDWYQQNRNGT